MGEEAKKNVKTTYRGGMEWEVVGRFKREWTYVYLWMIHTDVWKKPTQYYKAIIPQLKVNKFFKKSERHCTTNHSMVQHSHTEELTHQKLLVSNRPTHGRQDSFTKNRSFCWQKQEVRP